MGTSPMKAEATTIPETMNMVKAKGRPRRLASMEAMVCSAQVMGNQYRGWMDAFTPIRWICPIWVKTRPYRRATVGRDTKRLMAP